MRRYWPLLAVAAAAIALTAVVGVLRRDSSASTPGATVERFLDRVVHDRYDKATPLLSDDVAPSATPEALAEWKRGVESGLGKVRDVRGETEWISGEEAEATGILVAGHRERRLRFSLEREGDRWRIARLDDFWGARDSRTESGLGPVSLRERRRNSARPALSR